MNGVDSGLRKGLAASAVLRLSATEFSTEQSPKWHRGQDVLLAAVTHPPRGGEPRPIGLVLPDVLARYGLAQAREDSAVEAEPTAECDSIPTRVLAGC